MLRLELSSGRVVLLKAITGCLAHLCAEQIKPLSHNVFDFGRGSLMLVNAVMFWTMFLRTAQRCSIVRKSFLQYAVLGSFVCRYIWAFRIA